MSEKQDYARRRCEEALSALHRDVFVTECRLTLIMRKPLDDGAYMVVTADDLGAVSRVLERCATKGSNANVLMQGNRRSSKVVSLERLHRLARAKYRGSESEAAKMAKEIIFERVAQRSRLREFHILLAGLGFCGPTLDRRCLACRYLEDMENDE